MPTMRTSRTTPKESVPVGELLGRVLEIVGVEVDEQDRQVEQGDQRTAPTPRAADRHVDPLAARPKSRTRPLPLSRGHLGHAQQPNHRPSWPRPPRRATGRRVGRSSTAHDRRPRSATPTTRRGADRPSPSARATSGDGGSAELVQSASRRCRIAERGRPQGAPVRRPPVLQRRPAAPSRSGVAPQVVGGAARRRLQPVEPAIRAVVVR